jgi:hypothetical protein
MSSPLHNVTIHFHLAYSLSPALNKAVKNFIMAYYGCKGLENPRKVNHLTISSGPVKQDLILDAVSRSAPSHPTFNLKLQFHGMMSSCVEKVVPLFPSKHIREFTVVGLNLITSDWRRMLRKMKGLAVLRLNGLDIELALDALDFVDGGVYREATKITMCHSHAHAHS